MPVDYLELARSLNRPEFVAKHAGHFLLKRPKHDSELPVASSRFDFATVVTAVDIDPLAREWQVLPVVKRPDNPFPERMTVGRAVNCDLVLRVPFVSKVHAHILRGADGGFSLHDNRPSRATFHNKRKLEPGETLPLKVGDSIGFGSLEVEFVDAGRLHDVLRAEAV
jgi:hypothetical protein